MNMDINNIAEGAFELGLTGFLVFVVLVIVGLLIGKLFSVFQQIIVKFDILTERISDSNKELSNQLIKTYTTQENMLEIIKETMVAVNNSAKQMSILQTKLECNYEQLHSKTDSTVGKLENIQLKLEHFTSK